MADDFPFFSPHRPSPSVGRLKKWLGWTMLAVIVFWTGWFVYQRRLYFTHAQVTLNFSHYVANTKKWLMGAKGPPVSGHVNAQAKATWLNNAGPNKGDLLGPMALRVERDAGAASPVPLLPSVAREPGGPSPIHFEFYSTLPTMKVSAPIMAEEDNVPLLKDVKKTLSVTKTAKSVATSRQYKPQAAPSTVINEKELEDELSRHMDAVRPGHLSKRYVVQMGVFHQLSAALRYRQALSPVASNIKIITVHENGHDIYRVQQGPFNGIGPAKQAQAQLQQRGIEAIALPVG